VTGPGARPDRLSADSSRRLATLTSTIAASGAVTATMAIAAPTVIQNCDIAVSLLFVVRRAVRLADTSSSCRVLVLYSPSFSV